MLLFAHPIWLLTTNYYMYGMRYSLSRSSNCQSNSFEVHFYTVLVWCADSSVYMESSLVAYRNHSDWLRRHDILVKYNLHRVLLSKQTVEQI